MILQLLESRGKMLLVAERRFRRLKAPELMKDVYLGGRVQGWNRHKHDAGEGRRLILFTHDLT